MSVPKPARRRTYLKADDRRAQILDVAKGVFAQRGYRVANVADICAAARIGRGTLYQYFENKQAVLLAVMEELAARVKRVLENRPKVASISHARHAPVEMIVEFCQTRLRALLDAVFVDESALRLILREARGLDGTVDRVIATIDELLFAALETDLRAAQKAGVLRSGDARLMARYILGGVEKMVLTALAGDEKIDLDEIVQVAVQLELFGLLHPQVRKEVR